MADLTLKQTAEILAVSYQHVYELCKAGRFPAYKIGRIWRVNPDELNKFRRGEYAPKPEVLSCPSTNVTTFTISALDSKEKLYEKARNRAVERSRSN